MASYDTTSTNTAISQGGKSGGDASGLAMATSGAFAGGGGTGMAGPIGMGTGPGAFAAGGGGGIADSTADAMNGGDVTDNTSIGSININS